MNMKGLKRVGQAPAGSPDLRTDPHWSYETNWGPQNTTLNEDPPAWELQGAGTLQFANDRFTVDAIPNEMTFVPYVGPNNDPNDPALAPTTVALTPSHTDPLTGEWIPDEPAPTPPTVATATTPPPANPVPPAPALSPLWPGIVSALPVATLRQRPN